MEKQRPGPAIERSDGQGEGGGCGELGAPWGVTSLPPARWGDTLDLAGRGGLLRRVFCISSKIQLQVMQRHLHHSGAEQASERMPRVFFRFFAFSRVFLILHCRAPSRGFQGVPRNTGTSWGPPSQPFCFRTSSCSCILLQKAARLIMKSNINPQINSRNASLSAKVSEPGGAGRSAARGSSRSPCRSILLAAGSGDGGRRWGWKSKMICKKVSRQRMAEGRNFRKPADVGALEAERKKK